MMTVGQLREALAGIDDDVPVSVSVDVMDVYEGEEVPFELEASVARVGASGALMIYGLPVITPPGVV